MRLFFIFLFVQIYFNTLCQETLFETKINDLVGNEFWDQAFIDNMNNEKQAIILLSYDIHTFVFDSSFNSIKNIRSKRPFGNASIVLGCSESNDVLSIYTSNNKRTSFGVKNISFIDDSNEDLKADKIKNEAFLESFTIDNKFYLLTVQKHTSILKMRVYKGIQKIETRFFEFPFGNLYYYLNYGYTPGNLYIQKIYPKEYNPIDITFKKNKLYIFDDKIVFSFEIEDKSRKRYVTRLLSIDLNDFNVNKKNVEYTYKGDDKINVNSFLMDSVLVQKQTNNNEIVVSLKDVKNDKIIKEEEFNKGWYKDISFYTLKRKLFEKNSEENLINKAFKKMNTTYSAISACRYNNSDSIILYIGAYTPLGNSQNIIYNGTNNELYNTINSINRSNATKNDRLIPNSYNFFKERNLFNGFKNNYSFYYSVSYDFNSKVFVNSTNKKSALDEMIRMSFFYKPITSEFYYKKDDYYIFGSFNSDKRTFCLRKFTE